MSTRFSRVGAIGAAAAALIHGPAAIGAQPTKVEGIVVTAPRTIGKDAATGANVEQVSMSSTVRLSDLNAKTDKGAAELDKRVADAARTMCRELETLYPVGNPDANTCAQRAIKQAMAQVRAAEGKK
jgi:UrcA family protein